MAIDASVDLRDIGPEQLAHLSTTWSDQGLECQFVLILRIECFVLDHPADQARELLGFVGGVFPLIVASFTVASAENEGCEAVHLRFLGL
jgi:hypothetical protein